MHGLTNRLMLAAAAATLSVTGCATPSSPNSLPADHPANPSATETPAQPFSQVLASGDPAASLPNGGGSPTAAQHELGSMPGMSHGDMAHGGHATPSQAPATAQTSKPGTATPASAPATGAALYACPMHPEVTSTNPNDRCPKCGMKINKPVKSGGGGASTATTPPAGQSRGGASESPHQHGEDSK